MKIITQTLTTILAILTGGLIILAVLGEHSRKPDLYPPQNISDQITIYVTDLGYHAGIVLPAKLLKQRTDLIKLQQAASYFDDADWIEIGWGDKAFYQAGQWDLLSLPTMLRAAFTPTPTIMHFVGLTQHPPSAFAYNDVLELKISNRGLAKMMSTIDASLAIKNDYLAPVGLYGNSRFFPANGSYHMFNICNHWIARRLADAGLPVNVTLATWPGFLMQDMQFRSQAKLWPKRTLSTPDQ